MTLPLFDTPAEHHARRVTLVRLSGEIARAVGTVGRVVVEGEVYRPTTSRGGWVFFTLRDRAAQVAVRVPRAVAARDRIVAGERVSVVGVLAWTPDRGQLGFDAEEVMPVGEGAVAAMIAEVRARLGAEGLLDRPRRPIPVLPAVVGVVCGADAAVRKDIESVVVSRFAGYPLYVEEATVSGPGAAVSIVDALVRLTNRIGVEVIIVARGGGDAASLLPWSTEEVCRAVAMASVPVISAIGHDGDRPLCDEVADLRCGTPSIAAAAVVPDRRALQEAADSLIVASASFLGRRVDHGRGALERIDTSRALRAGIGVAADRLARADDRLSFVHPARPLHACRSRLSGVSFRRPTWERLSRAGGRLDAELRHLHALSHRRVLERGYAVVTGSTGAVVRHAGQVSVGERVAVALAEGGLTATIDAVSPEVVPWLAPAAARPQPGPDDGGR